MVRTVRVGSVEIGSGKLAILAGPCVLESYNLALSVAETVRDICARLDLGYIFKASFDKANRTSGAGFRGPGIEEGLAMLGKIREMAGVPVLTDIHEPWHAAIAAETVDLLQIPAFLCRQTDLVMAAARTGKPVNIKKAQFLAPEDMAAVVGKCAETGNENLLLCERGTTFGYRNLVVDMRSLAVMRTLGYPLVFDATHSVQMPGGQGTSSGGDRRFVLPLARAAAAVGIDALFLETHPDPDKALSDGPNMIALADLEALLRQVKAVFDTSRQLGFVGLPSAGTPFGGRE
ncbi:3-deoxy-8-phosphooctulonate synthase [Aminiphilus circumscriptus]|uniref:3-deoxy-8-phosphooctulonate synthase n=1 Tax=Aminiphilus circumscriptus TaxID=290732 RepID=UPI0004926EB8|nr:3-deoxy-8-phosphooctulonate synthase [Aminiphilus circumscriptus]